eukprot:gi/632960002/ref/XP_007895947.1/ PREDICTED: alpha 1,3-galactosyltransferase 2 isoform X2 [Callorhinchus milii]
MWILVKMLRVHMTRRKCFVSLIVLILVVMLIPAVFRGFRLKPGNHVDNSLDLWSRKDVQTCTHWKAPIIWEGTFNPEYYNKEYRKQNVIIGLTVFAVGNYLDLYLKNFLATADEFFMPGFPVIYYVFVDDLAKLQALELSGHREVTGLQVERHERWQDVSMLRMETISRAIETHIRHQVTYVFCFDVDQQFKGRFGTEALGELVGLLHAWYYRRPQYFYTYDHNPRSAANLDNSGDFYYHAAVFGGTWQQVRNLTESCYQAILQDKRNKVEARWHDESHLNKYFWLHKPTRVLSPEYCWDESIGWRRDIHVHRVTWAKKQYRLSRVNV